jgi:hypothetical protein
MPFPTTRDMVESLAETLPANQIEGMRAAIKQREAKGNPPDELFELHRRNLRKIHDAGIQSRNPVRRVGAGRHCPAAPPLAGTSRSARR